MAVRRIQKELKEILRDPPCNCSAGPDGENMFKWNATLIGPPDTPYENGVFNLIIDLPQDYPFKPPTVTFKTQIFHPNINTNGNVCLDILKAKWVSTMSISKILLSICCLLAFPNPDSPYNKEAANLYRDNLQEYNKKVREYTQKYAK
ncbi:Ubiquitin-conjugating enzyme E2 D1 [Tritrichomonas musculus]|uniref:Ubiquitin-conjugating enzyme E2 D1 n=1 Tax=Tritrichomonas musculus TaxID=1915356 RepID=A0ABR2H5G6_9EUKA